MIAGRFTARLFLVIVAALSLLPFYIMAMMGTHPTHRLYTSIAYYPGDALMDNLRTVFGNHFLRVYANSLYISGVSAFLCVIVSAAAGYALAMYRFRFRNALFRFVLFTMMVPSQLGLVALVIEYRHLHLLNSHWGLILIWAAVPFGVFWMKQYIQGALPVELLESARMDGCGELRLFWQIVLPYVMPAVVTLSLLIFLWSWNNFLLPLIVINKPELFTVPLAISALRGMYTTNYAAQMLGLTLGTLPLIVLFIVGARYFVSGFQAGAVKG